MAKGAAEVCQVSVILAAAGSLAAADVMAAAAAVVAAVANGLVARLVRVDGTTVWQQWRWRSTVCSFLGGQWVGLLLGIAAMNCILSSRRIGQKRKQAG